MSNRDRPLQDYAAHVQKHASPTVRLALVLAGSGFLVVGLAGIVVPVLPTTPFVLVAAACYARASRRFYNALLNNRWFGPTILEWRQHRSIARRTKWVAIGLLAVTLSTSIVFFVEQPWLRGALAVLGVLLAGFLYRVPSRAGT